MTWELEPTEKLTIQKSILPKAGETLILVAKTKIVKGVRAGTEPIMVKGQDGHFILTSFRAAFVAEIEGLPPTEVYRGELDKAFKHSKVFFNVPLVFLPKLQESPNSYTKWKKHMNLVLERSDGVQEVVYIKATGELLDFQRTSHDFFKNCFFGPIDFYKLLESGVKHEITNETAIYDLIGKRILIQMTAVPESLLQSYNNKTQKLFTTFISYLGTRRQGGYYDPVVRTIALRGDHVHVSLDWIAQSSNRALQQNIQQYIEEWRSKQEAKGERLGDRYEITGF